MDIETMVLRTNGFKIGKLRTDGSRTITKTAFALSAGKTFTFAVEVPAEGEPTLVITEGGRELGRKTDTWAEIASEAVALAFKVERS